MVKISSELLTSSSLPFRSLVIFGSVRIGKVNEFGLFEFVSDLFFVESGEMYRFKYGFVSMIDLAGIV